LTEKQLIEGCLKMNAKSQRELYQRFNGKMMAVCRRFAGDLAEAEDMLQEAFIKVFTNIEQYRFEGSLEGWIRRIVVHSALEVLRKRLIRFSDIDGEAETLSSPDTDAFDALSAAELMKLICDLPDGYRVVFNLYVVEGYDHNEIANLLNISASTSRSQLLKARRALQEHIKCTDRLPNTYAS
jgi:RNA polymerase sigma-70 factor (ECF subfamily)